MKSTFSQEVRCGGCFAVLIRPLDLVEFQPLTTLSCHKRMLLRKNLLFCQDTDGVKIHFYCRNCSQNIGFLFTSELTDNVQIIFGKEKVVLQAHHLGIDTKIARADLKFKAKQRIINGNQEIVSQLQQEFLKTTLKVISLNSAVKQLNNKVEAASKKIDAMLQTLSRSN